MRTLADARTAFRVRGLPVDRFLPLFALTDAELAMRHAARCVADSPTAFPDRITLRDAHVGESLILVNHDHLPEAGPYRSSHAIFVLEGAHETYDEVDAIPAVLRPRMLSLRAFDVTTMMIEADLVPGSDVEALIARQFANPAVSFIHVHYAKRGCYACRVDRAAA